METLTNNEQKQQKLRQWETATGLTLTLVPPTNAQRWVINVNIQTPEQKASLLSTVNQDNSVRYIEEDAVMTTMPIQRTHPTATQKTPQEQKPLTD